MLTNERTVYPGGLLNPAFAMPALSAATESGGSVVKWAGDQPGTACAAGTNFDPEDAGKVLSFLKGEIYSMHEEFGVGFPNAPWFFTRRGGVVSCGLNPKKRNCIRVWGQHDDFSVPEIFSSFSVLNFFFT